MKVMMIDPLHKVWEFFRGHTPSPGLLATISWLRHLGHEVVVYDGTTFDEKPWSALQEMLRKEEPDVVGITATITIYHHDAINAARLARAIVPNAKIIIGGQHVAATPEEHLHTDLYDAVVMQEAETTLGPLLDAFSNNTPLEDVKGIAFKDAHGRIIQTEAPPMFENLDELPMPAYEMMPMEKYSVPALGGKIGLAATFSRGCIHHCTYCPDSAFWKHTARQHSAERIVETLDWLAKDYDRHVFYVGDDYFLLNRERNEAFVREMERVKPDVRLWIQTTTTSIIKNKDLLPRLRSAGVFQLMVGLENVDPEILKGYKKSFNVENFKKAVELGQKHDFLMMGMLVWGAYNDTKESLEATIKYIIKHCDMLAPNALTPFPGTALRKEAEAQGLIHINDWELYDQMHILMPTKDYSVEEADKIYSTTTGKALMTNPKALANVLLLPKKPQLRTYMKQFYKMGFRFLIGKPWVQKNWQSFDDFLRNDYQPARYRKTVMKAAEARS